MTHAASARTTSEVTLRRATPADAEVCGNICYEAFLSIGMRHNFANDMASPAESIGLLTFMFNTPGFYAIVAEQNGKIVGSNVMFEADPIASIGPITVAPEVQDGSIGRRLMADVIARARDLNKPGIRLVQASYHARSLALYAKLGFIVRDTLAIIYGATPTFLSQGATVRSARPEDQAVCDELCFRVHGHDRAQELAGAIAQGIATVVERAGRITGYSTGVGFFCHAVAETNDDVKALIAAAPSFAGPGFLVPTRNADLFRWCLENGLRVKYVMTLMAIGLYNEPQGAWLPSVAY
ncbi:MAG: GNAT family N-acetyltransferase [Acidobacteriaceae bacterium]